MRLKAACVVIPLLFETNAESEFDATICVACSPATQRSRLAIRGWGAEQTAQRIAAQFPIEKKIAKANYVVWNEGSLEILAAQFEASSANFILEKPQSGHGDKSRWDSPGRVSSDRLRRLLIMTFGMSQQSHRGAASEDRQVVRGGAAPGLAHRRGGFLLAAGSRLCAAFRARTGWQPLFPRRPSTHGHFALRLFRTG